MHSRSLGGASRQRRFAVTVDGVRHEVIVEELEAPAQVQSASPPTAPTTGPGQSMAPTTDAAGTSTTDTVAANTSAAGATGGTTSDDVAADGWVVTPMPGTVTELNVNVGDSVQTDDVIVILTAMKLENEIRAPQAGVVRDVAIAAGDNVNSGHRLVRVVAEEGDK